MMDTLNIIDVHCRPPDPVEDLKSNENGSMLETIDGIFKTTWGMAVNIIISDVMMTLWTLVISGIV